MEKLFFLTVNENYLGIFTENYCKAFCKQFAKILHINATELNAKELEQGREQGFWTLKPRKY